MSEFILGMITGVCIILFAEAITFLVIRVLERFYP